MCFPLFDSLSRSHSTVLTVATQKALPISGEQGQGEMEGKCCTKLTCSLVILQFMAKAVLSDDYKCVGGD